MQIVNIKGKKWVIGLDWEILPGEDDFKKERKEVANKTNSNYGVTISYEDQYAIGLCNKDSKVESAAILLALANQEMKTSEDEYSDWIVIEEMGDDKYWVGVIKNGLPSPQYDVILDITTIKDKFGELMVNDTYKLFSNSIEIQNLFEGLKIVETKNLNDLTADIKTKIKIEKIRGIPNNVVFGGIFVLVVGISGVFALNYFEKMEQLKKIASINAKKRQESATEIAKFEEEKRKYEETIKESIKKARTEAGALLLGNVDKSLFVWDDIILTHSAGTHGWDLKEIDCYYNSNMENIRNSVIGCDFSYERIGLSTNRMFLEENPDAIISGNKGLVKKIRKDSVHNFELEQLESVLKNLPTAKHWSLGILSQLQLLKMLKIDYDVKDSSDIFFNKPMQVLSPEEIRAAVVPKSGGQESIKIGKGEIIIKGKDMLMFKDIGQVVDFRQSLGVAKANFKVSNLNLMDWELKINYLLNTESGENHLGSSSFSLQDTIIDSNGSSGANNSSGSEMLNKSPMGGLIISPSMPKNIQNKIK